MMNPFLKGFVFCTLLASTQVFPLAASQKASSGHTDEKSGGVGAKLKDLFSFENKTSQTQESKKASAALKAQLKESEPAALTTRLHVGVADIVEPLLPAVVNIAGIKEEQGDRGMQKFEFPEGHPFADLFRHFLEREMIPQPRKSSSLGSGFVVSPDGYIVTNYHVIADADKVIVSFDTAQPVFKGRFPPDHEIEAEVIGADPRTDIALLKVNEKNLPFVEFGDSNNVRVGDPVLTIGNPFGLGGTVTTGIISSRARDIAGRSRNVSADFVPGYFQTDASINVGNSGGPMFNMNGEVIGVNTAILSPSGGNIGIGFSIPADIVKDVVEQLKSHGRTSRGWLGIQAQFVDADIAHTLGLKQPTGALVGPMNPKGPAARSDLKVGDVILEFNGEKITESRFLPRIVGRTPVGKKVPVIVWRQGKEVKLHITVGEYEKAQDEGYIPSSVAKKGKQQEGEVIKPLGIWVRELNDAEKKELEEEQGLMITNVEETSEAFAKGLRAGHFIKAANGAPMKSPGTLVAQVKSCMKKEGDKKSILLFVGPKDLLRFVALKLDNKV